MKIVNVLTVCGSGTVSSSMVAEKIKDFLREKGYSAKATEVSCNEVRSAVESGRYDFIAYTSPVRGNFDIPAINAIGFLTGMDEEPFKEKVMEVLENLNK